MLAISNKRGFPDTDARDRPNEFQARNKIPKTSLHARLNEMLDQVEGTFSAVTAAELLETRIIQGYTVSGLSAIYGTMAHLEQHAGQILYLTKLRLGDAYRSRPEPLGETDY